MELLLMLALEVQLIAADKPLHQDEPQFRVIFKDLALMSSVQESNE
jgi:hypothetical protein